MRFKDLCPFYGDERAYFHRFILANDEYLTSQIRDNKTIGLTALFKFTLLDSRIERFCQSDDPGIQARWIKALQNQTRPGHQTLQPIPGISTFTLLKGQWCFKQYKKYQKNSTEPNPEKAQVFLMLSLKFGYFDALREQCYALFKMNKKRQPEQYTQILQLALRTADLYGTPGYILTAHLLNECAVKLWRSYPLVSIFFYQQAYTAVCAAECSEESSQAALNLAYPGQPLNEISSFSSWSQAKTFFSCTIRRLGGKVPGLDSKNCAAMARISDRRL